MKNFIGWLIILLLGLGISAVEAAFFNLPQLPPAEEYGNILINRASAANNVKSVSFSHWQHRLKYTCRVCHSELGFNMKTNTTEITELANRKGKYCGACHNGKIAFRHNGNCDKCHNGNIAYAQGKFDVFSKFPFARTSYGDGINWWSPSHRYPLSCQVRQDQIPGYFVRQDAGS